MDNIKTTFIFEEKSYPLGININGIIVGKNAFFDVWNNKVTLSVVYKSNGNETHSEESRFYKRYKAMEEKLTAIYGMKYCPEHCRMLDENNNCDVCDMEK